MKSLSRIFHIFLFVPVILLLSSNLHAQAVSTLNNYTGDWDDNGSWTGGTRPNPLFTNIGGQNITINGYITVGAFGIDQDLVFANQNNGFDLTVQDTLVIFGDVTFNVNSMNLIVNGFLIIFGDVTFMNRVDIEANGQIIVDGTARFQGGQGSFEGDGSLYANVIIDSTGGDGRVPEESEKTIFPDLDDDFPDIFDFVDGNGQTPLPVEVLYFTAEEETGGIKLSWATSNEENFDYFTIERTDQSYSFYELARIPGRASHAGTVTNYDFFDELPLHGYSFYRLKSTDYDGFTEYHGIVSVRIDKIDEMVRIYPNPVEGDRFTINFAGKNGTPFRLLTVMGEVVQEGEIVQGINEINLTGKLSPGIYLIRLDQGIYPAPQKLLIR